MPDSTVVDLTAASELAGDEVLYGVQGGSNRKLTANQIRSFVLSSGFANPVLVGAATPPSAPPDGFAYLYLESDGAGLYRLMVMFADGEPQQLGSQLENP